MDLRERGTGQRRHPWEVERARFFRRLLWTEADPVACRSLLDVGAGDGWFAGSLVDDLGPKAQITCWDINYSKADLESLADLDDRIHPTVVEPTDSFDVALLLDVLEHVEDAETLLAKVVSLVRLGGIVLVSVPAYPLLFTAHDEQLGHIRRYRRRELVDLLARHLEIVREGPLFVSLLAPRALQAALERAGRSRESNGIGSWHHGKPLTAAVGGALRADATVGSALSRRSIHLPGLSQWALGRRST